MNATQQKKHKSYKSQTPKSRQNPNNPNTPDNPNNPNNLNYLISSETEVVLQPPDPVSRRETEVVGMPCDVPHMGRRPFILGITFGHLDAATHAHSHRIISHTHTHTNSHHIIPGLLDAVTHTRTRPSRYIRAVRCRLTHTHTHTAIALYPGCYIQPNTHGYRIVSELLDAAGIHGHLL